MQYSITTTPEQDKLIQLYCDSLPQKSIPLPEGEPIPDVPPMRSVEPRDLIDPEMANAIAKVLSRASANVSNNVGDRYVKASDAEQAQVDEILGPLSPVVLVKPE